MVTTQKIVVSNERWVLNAEKATFTSPEGDVNISEGTNAPYAVLKFRDKNNPFSQTELTYIHKAPSILKGETIVYSADPTTAVQEAKANGYIMPKTLIAAVKNLSAQNQPTLVKYTEDECMYQIDGRDTTTFSAVYPLGTPVSTFKKEIENRGIALTVVVVKEDGEQF